MRGLAVALGVALVLALASRPAEVRPAPRSHGKTLLPSTCMPCHE